MQRISTPPTRIDSDQLFLRRYQSGDAMSLCEAATESIAEVHPFMEWCHPDYQLAESEAWIAFTRRNWYSGGMFDFGIFERTTAKFLGGCGLNQFRPADRCANLGYWIRSTETGKGHASAAAALLAGYGFEQLRLQRIEIVMAVTNDGSKAVAEKSGAIFEGTQRNRLRLHHKAIAAHVYSLIPSDLGL